MAAADRARTPDRLPYTGNPVADRLLRREPMALLIGFVLDQQFPIQRAFAAPLLLKQRVGSIAPSRLARVPLGELESAFAQPPALHRYPRMMARRVAQMSQLLVREYQGDARLIWAELEDAAELRARLQRLPGIGPGKSAVILGVLARHFEVKPDGWTELVPRQPSLADVATEEELLAYQAAKRDQRRELRAKAGAQS